jgi:ribosome-associated protein
MDLRQVAEFTDYFVILGGTSHPHMRAVADAVIEGLEERQVVRQGMQGRETGRWILLDYGDVIVHVMGEEEREFYSLERLWGDAPRVKPSATRRAPAAQKGDGDDG